MTTATLERPSAAPRAQRQRKRQEPTGHFAESITGRYRPIPAHQLALVWWLHRENHITRRQLRIWFATHEMDERRAYGRTQNPREKPVFRLNELQDLVGGRNSPSAARALQGDLRQLERLGLLTIGPHSLRFAKSIDTLAVGEGGSAAFGAFLACIPNRSRTVPVPRRTLRALAAGFGRAETACILAYLLRAVFWHRESGLYRIDGRLKLSEVAGVFGVSRRALTAARAHLIDLGWLQPLDVPQWAANRYGVHDVVNVHCELVKAQRFTEAPTEASPVSVDNSAPITERHAGESASPPAPIAGESASPCLNRSPSTKNLNTRRLGHTAPDHGGDRKKKGGVNAAAPPTIRDVQPYDLADTERLLELHRQAVAVGLAEGGGAGQLDFFSLANRARTRGHKPGALLVWFLREGRTDFITGADEEAASRRLREHLNGPDTRECSGGPELRDRQLSADEEVVEVSIRVAQQQGIRDPFRVAQHVKKWTRDRWDMAHASYQQTQLRHWHGAEEGAW